MKEELQGQVERITYTNEGNGYHVLKVRAVGEKDLVTVVGHFPSLTPGESLRMRGTWSLHARFGRRFQVESFQSVSPATVEGIRKYLGSGLIKGIGPITAQRIVGRFGEKTLDVIDRHPERLLEVSGIGVRRLERIRRAWEEQKEIRDIMVFLQGHGISGAYATRIFKYYGKDSLRVMTENPYRLAMDVHGIGFLTADRVAEGLGFAKDSPQRCEAGMVFVLLKAADEGHTCLPCPLLLELASSLLGVAEDVLRACLARLVEEKRLVIEFPPIESGKGGGGDFVLLPGYHRSEFHLARRLRFLRDYPLPAVNLDSERAIQSLTDRLPFHLAPRQREVIEAALRHKILVVTGGPGTGKTTVIRAILDLFRRMGRRVLLAAPTGRAAKRLSEATGYLATTLHRLLEFSPRMGAFQRNESRPLAADCLVLDEVSMLDTTLAYHFIKAVPAHAHLILVGDVDQLPSVGAGAVLQDLIRSERFKVVRLMQIFRQKRASRIVVNAHRIRDGLFPSCEREEEGLGDFYFIEKEDPEEVVKIIVRLCRDRIPARFDMDPFEDIQVLTPLHRGSVGSQRLNAELQRALNPRGVEIQRGGVLFRVGDKVMQVRNNYDKDVFNGDLGRIHEIDREEQRLCVLMDGRRVVYDFSEMDELVHAYAVTVHKAQGSEYPAVVFPIVTQHFMMLQRNLLYTAVTRARRLVVLVGTKKALAIALKNEKMQKRFTLLAERLSE